MDWMEKLFGNEKSFLLLMTTFQSSFEKNLIFMHKIEIFGKYISVGIYTEKKSEIADKIILFIYKRLLIK